MFMNLWTTQKLYFKSFSTGAVCRFYNLHHQQGFPSSDDLNISRGDLQGYRGLTMVDFYLACGLGLTEKAVIEQPQFSADFGAISGYFSANNLQPGRTVLLAPKSTGLQEYLPPDAFWIELA